MYASLLTPVFLISTAVAAKLLLSPSHFPVVSSEYDPKFAYPPKRDSPVSDTAYSRHTLGQQDIQALDANSKTISESSVAPPPSATSELFSGTTTLVTVTSTESGSAMPTNTVPTLPDDILAGVSNHLNMPTHPF
jgi:hypothetical protein